MKSLVLKFDDSKTAGHAIERIKNSGSKLVISPMNVGSVGSNTFDQLIVIGDAAEIYESLENSIGADWRRYVVQGEIDDKRRN